MNSTRYNHRSNLIHQANKHDLPHCHPDWFLSFVCVWPRNNEAGLTLIICIIYIHYLHSTSGCAERSSSTRLPNAESSWDTCWNTDSPLSNQLTSAQNLHQHKCLVSCFHVVKLVNEDLRAVWVQNMPGRGTRHPGTHLSRVRERQTGSSHPRDHMETGLQHPKKPVYNRN